jgi:hypothetical protein
MRNEMPGGWGGGGVCVSDWVGGMFLVGVVGEMASRRAARFKVRCCF